MHVPLWVWFATIGGIAVLVAIDIWHARSPHEVGFREATVWSVVYIVLALAFGVAVWIAAGAEFGTEYFTGWLVEKSLSVDNLFIFAVLMAQMNVPRRHQQKVLLWGVVGALVLRAVFISIGAAIISAFAIVFLLFGIFLFYTAYGLIRSHGLPKDMGESFAVRLTRRALTVHEDDLGPDHPEDGSLFRRVGGRLGVTPLFIAIVAVLSVDVVFALDSIPAIFGITDDVFLVFTANAFALLGLGALYFMLIGLLDRLVHLAYGLAVILGFIGVKLILLYLHDHVNPAIPSIPTWLSLTVIAGTLATVTITSLLATRNPQTAPSSSDER